VNTRVPAAVRRPPSAGAQTDAAVPLRVGSKENTVNPSSLLANASLASPLAWLTVYAATAVTMLLLDGLWLGVVARSWYASGIGHLMAAEPRFGVAAVFYALYPLGLLVLGVMPHAREPGLAAAAVSGALLGLLAYGTYDLTNLATLRDWPLRLSLIDMAWGCLLSTVATVAGKACLDRWLATALRS
jgi:uncharacterized membrane protein